MPAKDVSINKIQLNAAFDLIKSSQFDLQECDLNAIYRWILK